MTEREIPATPIRGSARSRPSECGRLTSSSSPTVRSIACNVASIFLMTSGALGVCLLTRPMPSRTACSGSRSSCARSSMRNSGGSGSGRRARWSVSLSPMVPPWRCGEASGRRCGSQGWSDEGQPSWNKAASSADQRGVAPQRIPYPSRESGLQCACGRRAGNDGSEAKAPLRPPRDGRHRTAPACDRVPRNARRHSLALQIDRPAGRVAPAHRLGVRRLPLGGAKAFRRAGPAVRGRGHGRAPLPVIAGGGASRESLAGANAAALRTVGSHRRPPRRIRDGIDQLRPLGAGLRRTLRRGGRACSSARGRQASHAGRARPAPLASRAALPAQHAQCHRGARDRGAAQGLPAAGHTGRPAARFGEPGQRDADAGRADRMAAPVRGNLRGAPRGQPRLPLGGRRRHAPGALALAAAAAARRERGEARRADARGWRRDHRAVGAGRRPEAHLHRRGQRAWLLERSAAPGSVRARLRAPPAGAAVRGRGHLAARVLSGRDAIRRRAATRATGVLMSEENLLKVLVLGDEGPTRNYLVKLLEGTRRAEVIGAVATLDEAREALAGSQADVVFVDVQLAATGDSRTGLDLIRSMAGEPLAPMFVLATASSEHSLEAFDLGVVDYILKPFTEERVEQCLRRLLERRAPRAQAVRRVVARRKKSLVFLDPETIWAFEAADRLTFVHSPDGQFDIALSLAAIEASFGRAVFRVHRNWLA